MSDDTKFDLSDLAGDFAKLKEKMEVRDRFFQDVSKIANKVLTDLTILKGQTTDQKELQRSLFACIGQSFKEMDELASKYSEMKDAQERILELKTALMKGLMVENSKETD